MLYLDLNWMNSECGWLLDALAQLRSSQSEWDYPSTLSSPHTRTVIVPLAGCYYRFLAAAPDLTWTEIILESICV